LKKPHKILSPQKKTQSQRIITIKTTASVLKNQEKAFPFSKVFELLIHLSKEKPQNL